MKDIDMKVLNDYAPVLMYDSLTATMFYTSHELLTRRIKALAMLPDMYKVYDNYKWKVGSNNYRKMHHLPMRRRWRS